MNLLLTVRPAVVQEAIHEILRLFELKSGRNPAEA